MRKYHYIVVDEVNIKSMEDCRGMVDWVYSGCTVNPNDEFDINNVTIIYDSISKAEAFAELKKYNSSIKINEYGELVVEEYSLLEIDLEKFENNEYSFWSILKVSSINSEQFNDLQKYNDLDYSWQRHIKFSQEDEDTYNQMIEHRPFYQAIDNYIND